MADEIHQLKGLRLDNSVAIVAEVDEWTKSMDGKYLQTSTMVKQLIIITTEKKS